MKTPYVSIDIETTGLDPEKCQILEIGAVLEDWVTPIASLPTFHCYVWHEQIVGEPFALSMPGNVETLRRIANLQTSLRHDVNFVFPGYVHTAITKWLQTDCKVDLTQKITVAGKNFAGFDKLFLDRLPNWRHLRIRHRVIDPAILYWDPDVDTCLPDTLTCMQRAGIPGDVSHTAVEDARTVVELVRIGTKRLTRSHTPKPLAEQLVVNLGS